MLGTLLKHQKLKDIVLGTEGLESVSNRELCKRKVRIILKLSKYMHINKNK